MSRKSRREIFKILANLIGQEGIPAFLRTRQPALGDRTGRELLKSDPVGLLERVRMLEKEMEGAP
jgi:hypothetical protein